MSKTSIGSPALWEAVNEGDGEFRVRVKGSVKKFPGFQQERTVAGGFDNRKDAVLAACAPALALSLRALLDD